jgi:VanZ family protein
MIDDNSTADGMFARRSPLVGYLTLAYLALVVYTSLHPFSEWRAPAQEVRVFLTAPWPAYFTWTDLIINVLTYVPVGAFLTLVLMPFLRGATAATLATILAILMSLTIEVLQVFLPGRIPSNADLLCNAFGAFLGANADIRLFGNGDVRQLLPSLPAVGYSPRTYVLLDAAITALSFCGVALMVTTISRSRPGAVLSVIVLMLVALALKTLAANMLFTSADTMLWVAPGAIWGLLIGAVLWMMLIGAPLSLQIACATTFIALALALVNAAPQNPYLDATLQVSRVGHYKSLIDLTNVVSGMWPFATIAFLTYIGYRLR